MVVADINREGGEETVSQIREHGFSALFARTDVSRTDDVREMVAMALRVFGRIDILHNNAYWAPAPLESPVVDTTEADWDRTLAVTLTGVFLGCKYVIPTMIECGGGVIVNTASTAGLVSLPRFAAYMAAKGGVVQLTRSVAMDYGARGIRCNAVCPGLIQTPATEPLLADPGRRQALTSRQLLAQIGQPEDIARAVLFLASDESSFITGQTLVVDGGRIIA